MKALTYILIFAVLSTLDLFAQTGEYDEEKKQINQIKRDNNYLYADELDETEEGALDLAKTILEMEVQQHITDNNIKDPSTEVIRVNMEDRLKTIELKRGEMFRVFAYILKDNLILDKEQDTEFENVLSATEPEIKEDILSDKEINVDEGIVPDILEDKYVEQEHVNKETFRNEIEERACGNESVKTGNLILDELTAFRSVRDIQPYLEKKKQLGDLMFGKMSSNLSLENSYLIIFNKNGEIKALLDKGTNSRRNLMTGKTDDNLSNYRDYGVVWIQLFNEK